MCRDFYDPRLLLVLVAHILLLGPVSWPRVKTEVQRQVEVQLRTGNQHFCLTLLAKTGHRAKPKTEA